VYKYLTLSKSFLKLDLINCVEFMITGLFVWYTVFIKDQDQTSKDKNYDYFLLGPEVFIVLLIFI
jgi:hypothetical protein